MGRSYYVDESVQKYFTRFAHQKNNLVTGLLIGQCSSQRDYIVLAAQTPPKEDPGEGPQKSKPEEMDEEWFCIHASQVSRMLPGGFLLLGVFLISPPELSKEAPTVLRKLIFATEKFAMKNKLWNLTDEDISDRVALQICSSTNKVVCRTFDVRDPKSTAKPADWKYQSAPMSWLTIECNVNVDLTVLLPSSATYQEQQKCTRTRLAQWAKELEDCTTLFNGRLRDEGGDLMEDPKKGRSAPSGRQTVSATFLTPSNISERSTARVQVCNSSLQIQGVVKCRGYVCNSKPKVKDAIQIIKRDLLNTISDRCEIMFEDLILSRSAIGSEKSPCPLPLPQRVFVPIPASGAALCDYIIGEETREEAQSRFLEMLDHEVNYEDLDFVEEKRIVPDKEEAVCKSSKLSGDQTCAVRMDVPSSSSSLSIGIIIAAGVVLLAILVYFLK
ncbi:protein odr-4 homolog [Rana temporaria]|uniref:protein odr-4 homolog n=1 Tax=Rana temporaria TaxID=8407 RepID=UPI001AAC508A|nr:protein odr-4 homolog [Rana temporaria]